MKEDKDRWNLKFSNRPMKPAKVPGFIKDQAVSMKPGAVLDIACGDGAASLYLAEKGFEVTACDISELALARLQQFAQDKRLKVRTRLADLDQSEALSDLPSFDYLVVTHFKPKIAYWPTLVSHLKPGGKLLLSTFNWQHHLKNNFSRRFCLEEKELFDINEQLELEYHASVLRDGSYMDDYLFRRI